MVKHIVVIIITAVVSDIARHCVLPELILTIALVVDQTVWLGGKAHTHDYFVSLPPFAIEGSWSFPAFTVHYSWNKEYSVHYIIGIKSQEPLFQGNEHGLLLGMKHLYLLPRRIITSLIFTNYSSFIADGISRRNSVFSFYQITH